MWVFLRPRLARSHPAWASAASSAPSAPLPTPASGLLSAPRPVLDFPLLSRSPVQPALPPRGSRLSVGSVTAGEALLPPEDTSSPGALLQGLGLCHPGHSTPVPACYAADALGRCLLSHHLGGGEGGSASGHALTRCPGGQDGKGDLWGQGCRKGAG